MGKLLQLGSCCLNHTIEGDNVEASVMINFTVLHFLYALGMRRSVKEPMP